jgi:hypothetical protein
MEASFMKLRCAGCNSDFAVSDKRKSAAMNIGGTFLLVLPWLWAVRQYHGNSYVMALAPMSYFLPYLLSLRYTSLSGRSGRTQAVLITGLCVAATVFFLVIGWIASKI